MHLWPQISRQKLDQSVHIGGVFKLSEPADSKTDLGFENCPRIEGVIEQNKIQRT